MSREKTLDPEEPHPCAHSAFGYVKRQILTQPMLLEAIASTALSGDRCAEICWSTIERIKNGEVVSDRYVLGLAWLFKQLEETSIEDGK